MINKIKDFLKKKLKRNGSESSDDTIDSFGTEPDESESFSVSLEPNPDSKTGLKDKLTSSFSVIGNKFNKLRSGSGKGDKPLLSPNLNRMIEKIISRSSRQSVHQGFFVLIICLFTYTLGKITALQFKGKINLSSPKQFSLSLPEDVGMSSQMFSQIKSIDIFRTFTDTSKKSVADTKCESSTTQSNLPIKLVNTTVLQDSVKSLASVQLRGEKELQDFRVGDQISNMAKIFKITRLELLIKNLENGVCELITSDQARETRSPISVMSPAQSRQFKQNKKMSGIDNEGNKFKISKALLDDKLKDIGSILTQARAIKIQNPDGSMSFKMTEIDPEGIFPYLGIQDQDIITSINGKPIYDMNEVMLLFGRIKNLDSLSLGIRREGSESVQDYSIKK